MSGYKLDFQKIKAEHPIERVAERLGLKLTKRGEQLRGQCPSGEGDDRALVITPAKGQWYSFSAQKGGDCISLVAFVKGLPLKDSALWIAGEAPEPEKSTSAEPSEGFKALDYLDAEHEAVVALGFEPQDAKRLGIGYAPRGILRGSVAIPVRTEQGRLAGYIGVTDAKLPPKWNY